MNIGIQYCTILVFPICSIRPKNKTKLYDIYVTYLQRKLQDKKYMVSWKGNIEIYYTNLHYITIIREINVLKIKTTFKIQFKLWWFQGGLYRTCWTLNIAMVSYYKTTVFLSNSNMPSRREKIDVEKYQKTYHYSKSTSVVQDMNRMRNFKVLWMLDIQKYFTFSRILHNVLDFLDI